MKRFICRFIPNLHSEKCCDFAVLLQDETGVAVIGQDVYSISPPADLGLSLSSPTDDTAIRSTFLMVVNRIDHAASKFGNPDSLIDSLLTDNRSSIQFVNPEDLPGQMILSDGIRVFDNLVQTTGPIKFHYVQFASKA